MVILFILKLIRFDFCFYKIDKEKQDFLNGMFIMLIKKELNFKMKFIE